MPTYPYNIFDTNLPLSVQPYNSRVEYSEITSDSAKNYGMIGFRPGFPLQASELNEIQDIFFLNMSLTTTMYNLWLTSNDGQGLVYSPGWLGTSPLWPEKFDSEEKGPLTNLVEYQTVTGSSSVKLVAKKGWYLVHSRSSGLKHWVYLNSDMTSEEIVPTTSNKYVGFEISYENVGASNDASLYDNASTNLVPGSPAGANRIKINIGTTFTVATTYNATPTFSPIAKINSTFVNTILYMNNRPVPLAE
jgi:hypothetical protein